MKATVSIALCTLLVACGGNASEETDRDLPRVSASRLAPRIVGGSTSTSAQDATVYLMWGDEGACTGTLVSANLVLTARHCVSDQGYGGSPECGVFTYDYPPSDFSVRVGVNAADGSTAAHVTQIHLPAGDDGCDDIALVQLDRSITTVKPAVVRFTKPAVGESTTAVGYGEDGFGWVPSQRRQRPNLPLKAVGPAWFDYQTQEGWSLQVEVPAKTIATGESTCYGDSGGPLFDAKGAVIGVTSRGVDDDCVDRPTLYTATSGFETLIRNAAKTAGQPLAGEVTTKSVPAPKGDATEEQGEDRASRSADDQDDGDLDEPSKQHTELTTEMSCSATPSHSSTGSSVALILAMSAALAIAARRRA